MPVLDDFNAADATNVDGRTASGGGTMSKNTAFSGGACDIRSNRARPGTGETVITHSQAIDRTYAVKGDVYYAGSAGGSYGGLWLGSATAKTGYEIDRQNTGIYLGKYVAGTYSALGSYVVSQTPGTTKAIEVFFDGNDVVVRADGTEIIRVTDSSVTPAVCGVYGGGGSTTTGFHIDNLEVTAAPLAKGASDTWSWSDSPAIGAAPGTPTVGTPTVGIYGEVSIPVTDGAGTASTTVSKVERSADGGTTWADITSSCTGRSGGSPYAVIDPRPLYGSQSTTKGGSAKYRVKVRASGADSTASSAATASNVTYDETAIKAKFCSQAHAHISSQGDPQSIGITGYVDGPHYATYGELQIGEWLMSMAYAVFMAANTPGWVGTYGGPSLAACLTDAQNQWTYIKSVATSLTGDRFLLLPDLPTDPTPDRCLRPTLHSLIAARLLEYSGDSGALTLAAEIRSKCDAWSAYFFDNFPQGTRSLAHYNAAGLTAAPRSTAVSVGMIRRPGTSNGHGYICTTAGTTGGSEPSWNTSAGSTTTDGTAVWTETGVTWNGFAEGALWNNTTHTFSGGTDYAVWVNKAYVIAATLSLLCTEPDCTSFYTAGTRRTNALAMITNVIQSMTTRQQSDGSWPYTDGSGGNATGKSTLYHAFNTSLAAMVKKLGQVSWPVWGDYQLDNALAWLEGQHGSEPFTNGVLDVYGTASDLLDGWDELGMPLAAYRVTNRSNPTYDVMWTGAMSDPTTGKWAWYARYGGGATDYRSGANYYPLDSLAIQAAVIASERRTASDSWAWADSPARTVTPGRTAGDTWSWSDAAARDGARQRTPGDTWSWSDAASGLVIAPARTSADTWLWQDQVSRPVTPSPPEDPGYRLTFDIGPYL